MATTKCGIRHWFFTFRCTRPPGHRAKHRYAGCSWTSEETADRAAYLVAHRGPKQ